MFWSACIALWGLLYYLIYLFTGNKRWLPPLAIFYIIYYVLLVYYMTASIPDSVKVGRWSTTLVYRAPLTGPFFVLLAFCSCCRRSLAALLTLHSTSG